MDTHRLVLVPLIACLVSSGRVVAQSPAVPPAGPPGTVTLSLADYNQLLDRAEHPDRLPDIPPIPSVLSRAEIGLRVAGARAIGTFALEGEAFQTGATPVPLVADATILSAKMGDLPVPLVSDGQTALAIIDGPRPFRIELAWGVALSSSPGRASIVIPVPTAGSASLSLDLPGRPADLRLAPGAITRTALSGDVTHVEATLVPGARTTLSWSSREASAAAAPREVRTLSDVKTLVSVGEADVRMTTLVDVTVVRGEPDRLELKVPEGFAVTRASGSALGTSEERPGILVLGVQRPAERRHQFLVSFERASAASDTALAMAVPSVMGTERETGEVAVEAVGTVELVASESDVLRRMDVREANDALRSLTRSPVLAALRYHRRGAEPPVVALNVTRFPDAPVIAAVAERAVVTTLATAEGRTLTEIALTMRNRAQPFLRVELPQGASIVSAEVDGQTAKPAQGAGGARIPLLRPGFRPTGPYTVSFVYVQSAAPFGKKGRAELTLPKMDVPVSLVEWEMFLPDRYRVRKFDGDALPVPADRGIVSGFVAGVPAPSSMPVASPDAGTAGAGGGAVTETIVAAKRAEQEIEKSEEAARKRFDLPTAQAPSQNVFNLQRRVAGVLPVRIDVPRAGAAYRFVRPLVLDEPTRVSFDYRTK
jgi:hypothetical protein